MTAPVVTKVIPGEGPNSENTFIVSFFIPPSHQSEPPSPSNPEVYLEEFPELSVYTISFSGFAKDKDFNEEAEILTDKTKEKSVHEEFYYTAGYDSPMKLINGPRREKTCLRGFSNNTGADQPAHPRSLISAFVIRV